MITGTSAREDPGIAAGRWGIAAVLGAMMLVVLDGAIANIALPRIGIALGIGPAAAVRIVTAYQLGVVVALLPAAALGESLGHRLVFRAGTGLFIAASVLCAAAPSIDWLVAARVLQGIGGAGILALGVALLRAIVPPSRFGAAIGWNAMTVALTSAAGPTLGTLVLAFAPWPWLFLINLPFGLIILLAGRALPRAPGTAALLDWTSVALNVGAFGGLVAGVEMLATKVPAGFGWILLATVCAALLIARQFNLAAPLLPLDLLGQPSFVRAIAGSILCFAGQTAGMIALPFYLQRSIGMTPMTMAVCLTLWPLSVAAVGPWAGKWADAERTDALCLAGSVLLCTAFASAILLPLAAYPLAVGACAISGGLGFGLFNVANNRRLFMAAPPHRSGAAGGLQGMARLIGQLAGGVLLTALFTVVRAAMAPRLALLLAAALALAAGIVSVFSPCVSLQSFGRRRYEKASARRS
ncbi:MAG: MFS transporter [Novosphingobium sp.]